MTLQFDSSAYNQILARKQNAEQQNNQAATQAISSIPQSLDAYLQHQERQQQQARTNKREDLLAAGTLGDKGYDPNAMFQTLSGNPLSMYSTVSNPQQNSGSTQQNQNAQVSPGLSQSQVSPMAQAVQSPNPLSLPSSVPQVPQASMFAGNAPQVTPQLPGRGTLDHWDQTMTHLPSSAHTLGQGQLASAGVSDSGSNGPFQKRSYDYAGTMKKLAAGDSSDFQNLPLAIQSKMLSDPAYKEAIKPVDQENLTPVDSVAAMLHLDPTHAANLKKKFANGMTDKQIGFTANGLRIDQTTGTKESQQQDRLETQYRNQLLSMRGDQSLKNIEIQRDAAITAYNRIKQVEATGKTLNPIDYVDILGQVYKARTGSAPTNEILSSAKQDIAAGRMNKVWTYFTGEQMPATSQSIQDSLKDMVAHMGAQADTMHDAYMAPHMLAPSGLDASRSEAIKNTTRGLSFQEATGYTPQPKTQGLMWQGKQLKDTPANRAWLQQQGGRQQ